MSDFIIVAGGARSGTSLTTMLIHQHGYCMGTNLKGAGRWNKTGYYEDYDILYLFFKRLLEVSPQKYEHVKKRVDRYEALASNSRYTRMKPKEILEDKIKDMGGFKCVSWMLYCIHDFLPRIPPFKLVVTKRNRKSQAQSINRSVRRNTESTINEYLDLQYAYVDMLKEKAVDSIEVEFDEWYTGKDQYLALCNFIQKVPNDSIYKLINPIEKHY